MKPKKNNVIIRGGYGLGNFGDDALMHCIYTKLKEMDIKDISLLCKPSQYIFKLIPEINIIDSGNLKENSFYCNLLVYGGGTQFFSFPKKNTTKRLSRLFSLSPLQSLKLIKQKIESIYKKEFNFENKFAITKLANYTALIGIGVGPFDLQNNLIEKKTEALFLESNFVAIRDEFSKKKCIEWNITDFFFTPDICYSIENKSYINKSDSVKKIGVIVRDWNHDEKSIYYQSLYNTVTKLRNNYQQVSFISFAKKSDKQWQKRLKGEDILFWDPLKQSINNFMDELNDFDLFITARYHGAIFSSLLSKPFISIELEPKLKLVGEVFKNGAEIWNDDFNGDELIKLTEKINQNYSTYRNNVQKKCIDLKNQTNTMFNEFKTFYNKITNE